MLSVSSGELIKLFRGNGDTINSLAFSPNGEYLVSGSEEKTIVVWRVSSGEQIKTFTDHSFPVKSVAFFPNGEFLASGYFYNTISVWRFFN